MEVETVDLGRIVGDRIDLLKMDIEGAEARVMKRLGETGKLALVDEMVVAYHHNGASDQKLSEVLLLLEEHGFSYQVSAPLSTPFKHGVYQDILICAYKTGLG